MFLIYLDESKYQEGVEPFHWLCGLAFPENSLVTVEERLASIATRYFGTGLLGKEREFHGKDIVHKKAGHKGRDIEERLQLYREIIDAIDEIENLKTIEVRLEPSRMVAEGCEEKAFMFFVEKSEYLMRSQNSLAMLISDHDRDMVSTNVASLSAYKARGTDYHFGTDIRQLVDTIHHTHSHHSRLIQLAVIYTYTRRLQQQTEHSYPQRKIVEYAKSKEVFGLPTKYKHWPTENSWYGR